jgi:hypothetical protein
MNAELWWDLAETLLVQSVLFSIAFVLGAVWHHAHMEEEGKP